MPNEKLSVVTVRSAGGIALHDVLDVLCRRSSVWIAAIVIWGAALALYAALGPRHYEAETVLLVKNARANLAMSPGEHVSYQGEERESQIGTELELLSQQDLLRRVVQKTTDARSGRELDEAVRKLRKNLEVTPVFKADLIRIKYVANDRQTATRVLSALLDSYMERHLQIHRSTGAYPFFDQQVASSEQELKAAEQRLSEYEKRNGIVLLNDQKESAVRSVADLEAAARTSASALDEARRQSEVLQQKRANLQARITTQKRSLPNQYSIERLNTMLTELQNKRTELTTKFRSDDRLVKEIDQQIGNTQSALAQARSLTATEEATDVNPLHQTIERELAVADVKAETEKIRHEILERQIHQQQRTMAELDSATAEHDNLARDVKRLEENYKLYSAKREEARISDAMDKQKIANVAVAEAPVAPDVPKPIFSGGLAGVFMLGCAVILSTTFAVRGRRQTFETPWELEASTSLPVLATLAYNREKMSAEPRQRVSAPRTAALKEAE